MKILMQNRIKIELGINFRTEITLVSGHNHLRQRHKRYVLLCHPYSNYTTEIFKSYRVEQHSFCDIILIYQLLFTKQAEIAFAFAIKLLKNIYLHHVA
jgi:hypothetical protein